MKERKKAPEVVEEVDREFASSNDGEGYDNSTQIVGQQYDATLEPIAAKQPQPKSYSDFVDYSKLRFGQYLICCCIALIFALSLIGYFYDGAHNGNEIGTAIELLKLVTTTALGFVFAKTQISPEKPNSKNK